MRCSTLALAVVLAGSLVAACKDDPGLTLVVDHPTGTDHLEVFIGIDGCKVGTEPCTEITPPAFSEPRAGSGYFLDASALATFDTDPTTASTTIRLLSDTTADRYAQELVVIAFDGQRTPLASFVIHGVAIPATDAAAWKVTLDPYAPPSADRDAPAKDGDHVLFWHRKAADRAGCVLVEHVAGTTRTNTFLVPDQDPDCDDVVRECDALWFEAPDQPGTVASCLVKDDRMACVAGGASCSEVAPSTAACAPLADRYCLPDPLCGACAGPNRLPQCGPAIATGVAAQLPRVDVAFNSNNGGIPCDAQLADATIDGSALLVAAGGPAKCTNVRIREATLASSVADLGFTDTASLTFPSGNVNTATMKVSRVSANPCQIALHWVSGVVTSPVAGLLLLDVESEVGHVVIPLRIRFESTMCASPQIPSMAVNLETPGPFRTCLSP